MAHGTAADRPATSGNSVTPKKNARPSESAIGGKTIALAGPAGHPIKKDEGGRMTARRFVIPVAPVALIGLLAATACDKSPSALTMPSSSGLSAITSNVGAVGTSVQQMSGQAFLLLDSSLTQLGATA